MRTWLGFAMTALLLAGWWPTPAAAAGGAPCREGRIIKANDWGAIRDFDGAFYVCTPSGRQRAMLGPSRDDSASAHVVLAERVQLRTHFVAWVLTCYCDDFSSVDVYRLDLRGRRGREYVAPALDDDRFGVILCLRVSRHGALAWVANDYAHDVPRREVWLSDGAGTRRLGRGTEIRRMRIRSGAVEWRQHEHLRRHRIR